MIFLKCFCRFDAKLMVNGALLLNKELYGKKHVSTYITILLQYYSWRLITIIILAWARTGSLAILKEYNMFKTIFLFGTVEGIDLNHLWFVPALLCVYLVVPFYNRAFMNMEEKDNKHLIWCSLGVLYVLNFLYKDIGIFLEKWDVDLSALLKLNPFQGLTGSMLFYFLLGGVLYRELSRKIPVWSLILTFCLGLGILLGEWYVKSCALLANWDSVFYGYTTTATIIMTVSVFLLVKKLSNNKIVERPIVAKALKVLGSNTINVYYMHWILGYAVVVKINMIHRNLGVNFVKAVGLVIVCTVIGEILKKIPLVKKLAH